MTLYYCFKKRGMKFQKLLNWFEVLLMFLINYQKMEMQPVLEKEQPFVPKVFMEDFRFWKYLEVLTANRFFLD